MELSLGICSGNQGPKTGGENLHKGQFNNLGYKLLLQPTIHPMSTKAEVGVCVGVVSLHESPKACTRRESKISIVGGY